MSKLPLSFYQTDDLFAISKALIGKYLMTCLGPEHVVTGGMIVEVEAYHGAEDKACHAYGNRRTKRTETMFGEGGRTYVYLCYGIHNLLNIVTNKEGIPHAILIRAIRPEVGIEVMQKRRKQKKLTTNGPGSVCQALGIARKHNGIKLDGDKIWLEDRGVKIPEKNIQATPRVGVDYAEEDTLKPWRFVLI